ncbi:accessory Sec system protein Asp2 [Listeria booriae]|uniref:accessory Sec system protein Asp2 n=1 Tax=Listeria booriae TaxID=1552123 RepID=UPI0016244FBC|nr:accessory Sec system protein Asp2 [Listeria booriae]MBC1357011.1 hypothetical protein [Listeria booriae]
MTSDLIIEKMMVTPLVYHEGVLTVRFKALYLLEAAYTYAYYIYHNDTLIESNWYEPIGKEEVSINYKPLHSGTYKFRLFLKKDDQVIINKVTNMLNVDVANKQTVMTTLEKEQVYYNDNPVKYLFQKAKKKSDKLLISFSGLHSQEFKGGDPVYNHFRTLWPCDVNKLFILDEYKGQFCYYMGHNCKHDYERSVIALITTIANDLGISSDNIIASGSSKGGATSLYYAMKYHFGTAIVGAPQVYIAKYLKRRAMNNPIITKGFHNLIGPDREFGEKYYDDLIMHLLETEQSFPKFIFHVGTGDFHYEEHLKPFLKRCDAKGIPYELDLQEYSDHNQTGQYYAPFLLNTVTRILSGEKVVKS